MQIDNFSNSMMQANKSALDANAKKLQEAKEAKEDAKLRDACKGFEAMFLNIMYKEMRKTVPKNELFGESNADEIMKDMLDTEVVNKMADAGGVGLADMLYKQLKMDFKAKQDAEARAQAANAARLKALDIKA